MEERFPDTFLFGAATSAHQVEGGNRNNDWWTWEHSEERTNALQRLGKEPRDFQSGNAAGHYERFENDFDIAKSLGHNAHRFSLEWSRIEPEEGHWDKEAMKHYRNVLRALKERDTIPFVTLHHFTNPLWFARQGGWLNEQAPNRFQRYVSFVAEHLGNEGIFWMTLNEPSAYAYESLLSGRWPPQKCNPLKALQALRNMRKAHCFAYKTLKARGEENVGIAFNIQAHRPATPSAKDGFAARIADYITWQWFLDGILRNLDFIGINYYNTNQVALRLGNPVRKGCNARVKSDMGWDVCPQGMRHVLENAWGRFKKPLYITENGIADADDSRRVAFITDHLRALHQTLQVGVDVRGYFYWSLLDNFEWSEGFSPRFGLVEVDYKTMKRTVRPSAHVYAEICRTGKLPENK